MNRSKEMKTVKEKSWKANARRRLNGGVKVRKHWRLDATGSKGRRTQTDEAGNGSYWSLGRWGSFFLLLDAPGSRGSGRGTGHRGTQSTEPIGRQGAGLRRKSKESG